MVKAICKGRLTFPMLTSRFNTRIISGFDSLFNSEIPLPYSRSTISSTNGRYGSITSSAKGKALYLLLWNIPKFGSKPEPSKARATAARNIA